MRRVTGIQPLDYHLAVAQRLSELEPAMWRTVAGAQFGDLGTGPASGGDPLHAELLRSAYRLDAVARPELGAAVSAASAALGVEAPVTLYQLEGDRPANATLLHRPGEAVIAFSGGLLQRLDGAELTAVIGHELAHHRLWTLDGARFLVADRMLDALALDARTPPPFVETARRWNLATELFADRGALAACGDLHVAVSSLVKVATGLAEVDPVGYLRQAAAADPASGSRGQTHPETVLRAWALQQWHADGSDRAVAVLLDAGLDLNRLDLTDRERLERLTRNVIEAFLSIEALRTDTVLAHARQYFPDLGQHDPDHRSGSVQTAPVLLPERTSEETRRYLGYVLLDLATVDDLDDAGATAAGQLADRLGFGPDFAELARVELAGPDPNRPAVRRRNGGPGRNGTGPQRGRTEQVR